MGENMGVEGVERAELMMVEAVIPGGFEPRGDIGKASRVEVTRRTLSTARKYLPIYL